MHMLQRTTVYYMYKSIFERHSPLSILGTYTETFTLESKRFASLYALVDSRVYLYLRLWLLFVFKLHFFLEKQDEKVLDRPELCD